MIVTRAVFLFSVAFNVIDAVLYGRDADPGQFPYQVLLTVRRGDFSDMCGGAIIDERHVLTAWHCVEDVSPGDVSVTVGAVKFHGDPNAKTYASKEIKLHENRACKTSGQARCYDIALIKVTKSIEYNEYVNEVPLPTSDITIKDDCVFAGWGFDVEDPRSSPGQLHYGYGTIRNNYRCLVDAGLVRDYEFCFRNRRLISVDLRTMIQPGDSGSPLVCDGVLTGVIIRGSTHPSIPGIAINVYKILDFINTALDDPKCCCIQ